MKTTDIIFNNDEKAVFALRSLYGSYGYSPYKMSKFEEYDLYARNKDFLISDNVITFTDVSGKLMALKPDVTLSIVKSSDDTDGVQKVYYNENVYRVSKGTGTFREIMQVGLECIGNIDDYCISEVLLLAAKSLKSISDNCVLDVSDLGIITGLVDGLGSDTASELIKCIGEKNVHGITGICEKNGIDCRRADALRRLCTLHGSPDAVLSSLLSLGDMIDASALRRLTAVTDALKNSGVYGLINIDFSVVGDTNYYNGITFKGFIEGIPSAVLTGGQYDRLMHRMGRSSGAIGFAVYLDLLEQLDSFDTEYDVDTVVLYDDNCDTAALLDTVSRLCADGSRVTARRFVPEKLKYRRLMKFDGREVTEIENDA